MKFKKIIYSNHLKNRLLLRRINDQTPKIIFEYPDETYFDAKTDNFIAIKKLDYLGRNRDIMVVYNEQNDTIKIITIHPLKRAQKIRRIESGRWKKYE